MSEFYRERYPELKHSVLPHSFTEPLPEQLPLPPVGSPLRLVFCGNVNPSCEDAAVRMAEAIAGCRDARLSLVSGTDRGYLQRLGILRDGVTCEAAPRDKSPAPGGGRHSPASPRADRPGRLERRVPHHLSHEDDRVPHQRPSHLGSYDAGLLSDAVSHGKRLALVVDQADIGALRDAIQRLRSDEQLAPPIGSNALKTAEQFPGATVVAEFRKWLRELGRHVRHLSL